MLVKPIAFDSLGVRSMATFVETKNVSLLIDPAAALAPKRYGLSPHAVEWLRLDESWASIKKYAEYADILVLTHYHYDHHSPNYPEIFKNKVLIIKDPAENINPSQRWRAAYFLQSIQGLPKEIKQADGKTFSIKGTTLSFSQAVSHGVDTKLGYVVELSVRCGGEIMHFSSDVQGPATKEHTETILDNTPHTLIVDGPPTYLLGSSFADDALSCAIQNLLNITKTLSKKGLGTIILDHHLLRDLGYKEKMHAVYEAGEECGVKVLCAAEYLGKPVDMLEARRRELYTSNKM
ncbi:MAG: hypothetical protein QXW32_06245 [Nitrososphaerales archaeon]